MLTRIALLLACAVSVLPVRAQAVTPADTLRSVFGAGEIGQQGSGPTLPPRTVRTWQLRELWGGGQGKSATEGVAGYRAKIAVWDDVRGIGEIFFHEPGALMHHPQDSVTSAGFIRMHLPVALLREVLSLLQGAGYVQMGFDDGHGYLSTSQHTP